MPSVHAGSEMMQFNNLFDYLNISATDMNSDVASQQATLMATAASFGHDVVVQQLQYVGATANARLLTALRGTDRKLSTVSCTVTIEITVPVAQLDTTNATAAWIELTDALDAAFESGAYQQSLNTISIATNAQATANTEVSAFAYTSAFVFESSASPTVAPTAGPRGPPSGATVVMYGFFALISLALLVVGLFIHWTQARFHSGILGAQKSEWFSVVLCAGSLYNFLKYMTIYGDHQQHQPLFTLNPLLVLTCSRVITCAVCAHVLGKIFGASAASMPTPTSRSNSMTESVEERAASSLVSVDNIPLHSLLYRSALGYSSTTLANTNDDSRQMKMRDSTLFPAVFPAYVALIVFATLESKLIRNLPWIKTEKTQMLNGYPTLGVARICLYGSIASHALQLLASLLNKKLDGVFVGISGLQFLFSLFAAVAFLRMSEYDEAKLAIVDISDLSKIEDYDFLGREQPSFDIHGSDAAIEDSVMSFEALRKTLALPPQNKEEEDDEEEEEVAVGRPSPREKNRGLVDEVELSDMKPGVFTTRVKHADKTTEMLIGQLKDAGKVAILYIPLDELNAEIAELMAALNAEKPYDEARLDYLLLCLDANPEHKAQKAKELEVSVKLCCFNNY